MLLKHKQESSLRLSKNNKGVTLVEVIALIAVLSVVVAAVTGFMLSGTKMSAKVSGVATDSMKEQTAVEFINKTILHYGSSDLDTQPVYAESDEDSPENQEPIGYVLLIKLSEKNGTCTYALLATENDTVVYQVFTQNSETGERSEAIRTTELCPGKIYFEKLTNNTVTYDLNGEKHVVHLRVAAQPDEP